MRNFFSGHFSAAILPVVVFDLFYQLYLYVYYRYTEDVPLENKNFGYVLAVVLLVTRLVNLSSLPKTETGAALLTWTRIGSNLLVLLVSWLAIGNIMGIMELLAPFRENMVLHIFLLFTLSLVIVRELLWKADPPGQTDTPS